MPKKGTHGRADYRRAEAEREWGEDGRYLPQAVDQPGDVLPVEEAVCRDWACKSCASCGNCGKRMGG